jgi:hypothetical protein
VKHHEKLLTPVNGSGADDACLAADLGSGRVSQIIPFQNL